MLDLYTEHVTGMPHRLYNVQRGMDVSIVRQTVAQRFWPWIIMIGVCVLATILLRWQGRLWICACGSVRLWVSDIRSSDTSQHLFDPYSVTHIEHGLVFFCALSLVVQRLAWRWQSVLAIAVEALWEVLENSAFVIERYRAATFALGYTGDTIVNSLGDICCCGLGLVIAHWLGVRRTIALFFGIELVLLIWIKDTLLLNVLMLLFPIEAIKTWQMAGGS